MPRDLTCVSRGAIPRVPRGAGRFLLTFLHPSTTQSASPPPLQTALQSAALAPPTRRQQRSPPTPPCRPRRCTRVVCRDARNRQSEPFLAETHSSRPLRRW